MAPPSSTFTLFSKLPPELQSRIWSYAVPGPRTLMLFVYHNHDSAALEMKCISEMGDGMHLACKASRKAMLKTHKDYFPTSPQILADLKNDTIAFMNLDANLLSRQFPGMDALKTAFSWVRRLGLPFSPSFSKRTGGTVLQYFPALVILPPGWYVIDQTPRIGAMSIRFSHLCSVDAINQMRDVWRRDFQP